MNCEIRTDTRALLECFKALGERYATGDCPPQWEADVIELLDTPKNAVKISTALVEGQIVVAFGPSAELLRHL